MSRRRNLLVVLATGGLVATALAACGALDPYPTAPAATTPTAGVATGPRVAICYSPAESPLSSVEAEATQECLASTPRSVAVPAETDWYLQNCPLLLPARANFTCLQRK